MEGGPSPEDIKRIRIPDEDAHNWIATLHEGGFSDEEIDHIMANLNATYAEHKGIDPIEEELKRIEERIYQQQKRRLTEDQKAYLRKGIATRLGHPKEKDDE